MQCVGMTETGTLLYLLKANLHDKGHGNAQIAERGREEFKRES